MNRPVPYVTVHESVPAPYSCQTGCQKLPSAEEDPELAIRAPEIEDFLVFCSSADESVAMPTRVTGGMRLGAIRHLVARVAIV